MEIARQINAPPAGSGGARAAWTEFWQDPAQNRCFSGAPDIWRVLTAHWSSFARSLEPGTRILDLGCGAGIVSRLLLGVRTDVHVTGVDFARLPLTISPHVELLSDTAMECLPFAERSFSAVVSQFGFEYSRIGETAREVARVMAPEARLLFVVHHAESAVVTTTRARLAAILELTAPPVRTAFCAGDAGDFATQMAAICARHPNDALVMELARSLPTRLGRVQRERVAIWNAIEEALAPERCIAGLLGGSCVAAADLEEWLAPLRGVCGPLDVSELREGNGEAIAWRIEGTCRPASG